MALTRVNTQAKPICLREGKIRVGILHWRYEEEEDLRPGYAKTDSQPVPHSIEGRACAKYCELDVLHNKDLEASDFTADLVVFSATDHGRAFGVRWCKHAYPFAEERVARHHGIASWGALTFEHLQQFPQIADPVVLNKVQMQINYHQNSTVPVTWFCPQEINPSWDYRAYFDAKVNLPEKRYLVAAVASRCRNDWQAYVAELQSHVEIRTYGRCWGDAGLEIPSTSGRHHHQRSNKRYVDKVLELSKSKFTLVFENTMQITDYVSEKLSHALLAGTVPVIWGAPNIAQFLPTSGSSGTMRSAIIVSHHAEFERNPRALADYLLYLHGNDTAYLEYFAWKHKDVQHAEQVLGQLTAKCFLDVGCRLCDWAQAQRVRACAGA